MNKFTIKREFNSGQTRLVFVLVFIFSLFILPKCGSDTSEPSPLPTQRIPVGPSGPPPEPLNGSLFDLLVTEKHLYAGGAFYTAPDLSERFAALARWDGTQWEKIDGLIDSVTVSKIAITPDGMIYAAGGFGLGWLGKWDGATWHFFGTDVLNDQVKDIFVDGSNVYVAGAFTNVAGISDADYVARWDGKEWHAIGRALPMTGGGALSVASYKGVVYVNGAFSNAGTVVMYSNGDQWLRAGDLLGTANEIMPYENDVYFCGTTLGSLAFKSTLIVKWNGTDFQPVGDRIYGELLDCEITYSGVYVTGQFTQQDSSGAERYSVGLWDGSLWQNILKDSVLVGGLNPGGTTRGHVIALSSTSKYWGGVRAK